MISANIHQLNLVLTSIVDSGQCDVVAITDKSGRLITYQAETSDFDKVSISSFVCESFLSDAKIANLIGEKEFQTIYMEGTTRHLYATRIDQNHIILTIFTDRSNIRKVKVLVDDKRTNIAGFLK